MARPKIPLLSRQKVVSAALDIIEAEGVDNLTLNKLSKKIGVNHASLYHHYKDKDAILDDVIRHVLPDVVEPEPGEDVLEWIVRNALTYREMLVRYPGLGPLMARRPHMRSMPIYKRIVDDLQLLGLTKSDAEFVLEATEALVLGYSYFTPEALSIAGGRDQILARFEQSYRALLNTLVAELLESHRAAHK